MDSPFLRFFIKFMTFDLKKLLCLGSQNRLKSWMSLFVIVLCWGGLVCGVTWLSVCGGSPPFGHFGRFFGTPTHLPPR